ncbi:MAG: hypothetical protein HWN51_02555 [Desulfobacterales bacterium]|nr:hypothetical protein [Desulfobacterales bacterium]
MANVAEVGSLLRVEERLQDILAKAGRMPVSSGKSAIRNPQSAIRTY